MSAPRPGRAASRSSARTGWRKALAEAGIDYLHEGAALGGKPEGGGSYDDLAARPDFAEALDRLIGARRPAPRFA